MVNEIVREVNACLDNGCCIAGLSLALTLPDICGKAYYPQLGNKRRYKKQRRTQEQKRKLLNYDTESYS